MTNIQPGDRCEVIKWPCCGYFVESTTLVTAIKKGDRWNLRCTKCGITHRHQALTGAFAEDHTQPSGQDRLCLMPVEWLRKLPPLTEPENIETSEGVTA